MLQKPFTCLFAMFIALALLAGLPTGSDGLRSALAEEPEAKEDGEKDEKIEGKDLGESTVPFVDRVNTAIEKGTAWLHAKATKFELTRKLPGAWWGFVRGDAVYGGGQMKPDEGQYMHPAGATALALYTLLKCGVDPKDDVIDAGFNFLREKHPVTAKFDAVDGGGDTWRHIEVCSSYELSAMILAVTARYDKYKKTSASKKAVKRQRLKIKNRADKEFLIELVDAIVDRRGFPEQGVPEEDRRGWRYNTLGAELSGGGKKVTIPPGPTPPNANQDLSSTQLAALALYNADRFGVRVKPEVWMDILTFTLDHQEETGPEHERYDKTYEGGKAITHKDHARGFMYIKGSQDHHEGKATSSMTACGITNLLICRDVLENHPKAKKLWAGREDLHKRVEQSIWDGIAWLDKFWSPLQNRTADDEPAGYAIYYLYAMERAMDIMGRKLCGSHLWYEEGAKSILDQTRAKMIEVKVKRNTELRETNYWQTGTTHQPQDVLDTCFALLFLKRATKGIMPNVTGE